MRIGINTLFLVPGDVGGTEVYLRALVRAMVRLSREDRFVLFTNQENDSILRRDLAEDGISEFCRLPVRAAHRPLRILAEQSLLPLAVRKRRVDVLWSPGYTAPCFCPAPQVVTIHDVQYKKYPEDMPFLERMVFDALVRAACSRCRKIIAISAFSREEILRHKFAPAEKVCVVPSGVATEFAGGESRSPESDSRLKALRVRQPYLLCVAHTYPHKHVDRLVLAFARLQERIPHQLVLVGKPRRGEPAVAQALRAIRDPQRVVRLQGLDERDLRLLYRGADVFILPSAYEGFGLPVLEALMAEVPVVVPALASLPEVGGQYVEYVPCPEPEMLADAIRRVLAVPPEEKQRRGVAGRQWARSFTWEQAAVGALAVLRRAVGQ